MNKYFICCLLIMSFLWINGPAKDQAVLDVQDTEQKASGNGGDDGPDGDELFLDDIEIKGRVDKPSVIIMPKRIDPEVGEVLLEREFEQELKEGMGEIPQIEDETSQVENVQSIKRAITKDRK